MRCSIRGGALAVAACLAAAIAPAAAIAKATPPKTTHHVFVVCKRHCHYKTIQGAVNASGRNATVEIKPGIYPEGVVVAGHRHNGLTIEGIGKTPSDVYLNGGGAQVDGKPAQNAIAADNVADLTLANMKESHYAVNGVSLQGCNGYLIMDLIAGFDRVYGISVDQSVGGRITDSTGYGNPAAAFSIAATPVQRKPQVTSVDHDVAYENVLGYSGPNSKYVRIAHSTFYDNGAGVVASTLAATPTQPSTSGVIVDDRIFWNNFDYELPGSPVKTVTGAVADGAFDYPIGAGVVLFGTTGWVVKDNQIFGNWLWGAAAFSDPDNTTGLAQSVGNEFVDNQMGYGGKDLNGTDFFSDGSGHGTCFASTEWGLTYQTSATDPDLYPTCPTSAGTGTVNGDGTQVALLVQILSAKPPTGIEAFWHRHPHVTIKGITPLAG
jgi:hypothetical protein